MKKLLLSFFICICLIGCTKKFEGKEIEIELTNLIVDEYKWEYKIENNVLENISGFNFKALKKGEETIIFKYSNDSNVLYDAIYKLNVDEKGEVKIIEKTGNYFALERFLTFKKEDLDLPASPSDYLIIFDDNKITYNNEECYRLNTFVDLGQRKYNMGSFLISIDYKNVYKIIDGEYKLIEN